MSRQSTPENKHLRPPCIYKERAVLVSYPPSTARTKNTKRLKGVNNRKTTKLPIGTQAKFQEAAYLSFKHECPLNTLVTIRSCSYPAQNEKSDQSLDAHNRVKKICESIRKWLTRPQRRLPVHYIWTRENTTLEGEHFHTCLFLPERYRSDFIEHLDRILVDPIARTPRARSRQTKGEIACSQNEHWHLAVEMPGGKPEHPGYWLASYLAKGEPSKISFRNRPRNNERKLVRGVPFEGWIKKDHYDQPQGLIEGNEHRYGRFGISRALLKLVKVAADKSGSENAQGK